MNDRNTVLRGLQILAATIFVFWWLVVLGDATQVPFTFPVVLENHEQFLVLFVSVVLLSAASLLAEEKAEMGE